MLQIIILIIHARRCDKQKKQINQQTSVEGEALIPHKVLQTSVDEEEHVSFGEVLPLLELHTSQVRPPTLLGKRKEKKKINFIHTSDKH